MKTGRNRLWRQDHPRLGRARCERPQRRARWAPLLLIVVTVALATTPALAATGGASTTLAVDAEVGGVAFSPMRWAGATWYGPGLYGNHTACGQLLLPHTLGVAHRNLPCGTVVKFVYRGRQLVTQVIDRGPYSEGNAWDLTQAAARALSFEKTGADRLRYAVSREYARATSAKRQVAR